MASIRKFTMLFLLFLLLGALVFPAAATVVEYEGLEVSVVMDKETYEPGEPITATITVTNVGSESITIVNLEQLIPEGYVLAENSDVAMKDVQMDPGRILVLQVTFQGETGENAAEDAEGGPGAFLNTILYGKTGSVPNMFIAVMVVLAIGLFLFLT